MWLLIGQVCLILPVALSLQCMSSSGKPVDWYIVYKLPKLPENKTDPMLVDGLGHFYMDIKSPNWVLSKTAIDKPHHAIYNTLQQIYSSKQSDPLMYLMYSDEGPDGKESTTHGYTKGVIAFDHTQGFWMIHSTPEFPPEKDKGYSWPDTARDYGQSFLCITFDFKMLNNIGKQLMYNFPQFYEKFNTDFYTKNNPYLNDALLGKTPKASPWQSEILLTSSGGTKFTSFAKYANFGKDLYDAWVAPTFKSELFSETWQNGQGKLSSYCSGNFHVLNVQKIKLPEGIVFKETVDNAKWAISQGKTTWVCIGDINRQTAQEKRAGGTACFDNSVVWRAFNEAVDAVENCPKVPGLWVSE